MKQLRVAILGQGRSGRDIHGAHLIQVPDMYKIVAVVDPLEERRRRAEKEYGCETFENHSSLIGRNDLDIVINATPSHFHVPITMELLNGGLNVLCDKPFARTVKEVDMLIETAKKSRKTLAVFQQSRYAPYFQQVKKVIASGVLGRIIQISSEWNGFSRRWDWQCVQEYNGGSLRNTGPHPVDQLLRLLDFNGMPEVMCVMDRVNTFGDAEDYVKLVLRAPGRPVIDLEISSCCAYPSFTFNVQGSCGGLNGSTEHLDWKYFKPAEAPEQHLIITPLQKDDGTPKYCSEELKWYEDSWDISKEQTYSYAYMSKCFYEMLYRTMAEGKPLEITLDQVRQQIAVIEEAHRQNPLPRMKI